MARLLREDAEWGFFGPFLVAVRGRGGHPASDHRRVLDGIFWIARTGVAWRDLPDEFGKWSSVYRQIRRWTLAGLWELVLDALNGNGAVPDGIQMIDSTVIRAHHLTAGAKGGLKVRVLAVQKVASPPRSTSLPKLSASLSGRK
ncbi:transposase [Rhizorhapis sp. SPR117]|uniref:transposase n=1 Tax=Rhizorhapis sp. SPR117 TaxID=2912611 RepID=UPI00403E7C85